MSGGKIAGVALVLYLGIWLETKLTGTSVNIDLLQPQLTKIAPAPTGGSASAHTSAQKG